MIYYLHVQCERTAPLDKRAPGPVTLLAAQAKDAAVANAVVRLRHCSDRPAARGAPDPACAAASVEPDLKVDFNSASSWPSLDPGTVGWP